ncbi:phosphoglycerate mutase [Aureimonas sp. SA4125]|uniref:histidine phosphatase family protein n=1 Tax=Aureimonas sp. SA4125 TaxID=2826993 RepID=UPI001CC45363|nr:histidine phosphatase family protein [Aureimonas sp. SA4125]BDA86867.1 phosphoglycerate mutase [Aureimonas sp. SA4125]
MRGRGQTAFFISHPEVVVDPVRPVPAWHLSDRGVQRMRVFAANPDLAAVGSVWSSGETKAVEAAGILAAHLGLGVSVCERLGENDRSATGFLPPAEFEAMADAFFAQPQVSVEGWERAIDAQDRIVAAVDAVLNRAPPGDVAIVAHGGVGTLLLCRLQDLAISRSADQPFQGHYFCFDRAARRVIHGWRPIAPR